VGIMAMVPASRPKQSRETTEAMLGSGLEGVQILVVRGYYLDSMGRKGVNDHAMYDDAVFVVSPNIHLAFNANTDPQKSGQKKAKLDAGEYRYYRGLHKSKYNALRPYPEGVKLPCTRDGVTSLCSHTNIHKGGFKDTFSEGCITIYPPQYDEFIKSVYAEMKRLGQQTIRVKLVNNNNSATVSADSITPPAVQDQTIEQSPNPTVTPLPILRMGDKGEHVKTLQRALHITADGIFGSKTKRALVAYQTRSGLTPDGVAGPKTYAKLGI
jgi:hypothetical protein